MTIDTRSQEDRVRAWVAATDAWKDSLATWLGYDLSKVIEINVVNLDPATVVVFSSETLPRPALTMISHSETWMPGLKVRTKIELGSAEVRAILAAIGEPPPYPVSHCVTCTCADLSQS